MIIINSRDIHVLHINNLQCIYYTQFSVHLFIEYGFNKGRGIHISQTFLVEMNYYVFIFNWRFKSFSEISFVGNWK